MQLKGALEENVLTLLVWNETESPKLILELTPDLFSTRAYRKIASHAFTHVQKFGKPPKAHIKDLLEPDLKKEDGKFLASVIEAMEGLQAELQPAFVLEHLEKFIETRKLSNVIENAAEAVAEGDNSKANEILSRRENSAKQTSGIYLSDTKAATAFLDETEEEFFSSGIEVLDQHGIIPARGEIFLFMAPPKRGKTWSAIGAAKAALLNKQSVLHITLEMKEPKVVKRYIQAMFAMSTREADTVRVPTFQRDDLQRCTSIDFYNFTPKTIKPENRDYIVSKLEKLKRRKPILIKQFPTGMLTISQLNAYLDLLERKDGFIPDLLIVDYPDLMALDAKNLRIDSGRIIRDLRGLAVNRNMALYLPIQGNRPSSTAKLVTEGHSAEDWSRVMTADSFVTYNQTLKERSIGLARIFVAVARNDSDKFITLISQSYKTGQFCIDSVFMNKVMEDEVNQMTGEGAAE